MDIFFTYRTRYLSEKENSVKIRSTYCQTTNSSIHHLFLISYFKFILKKKLSFLRYI